MRYIVALLFCILVSCIPSQQSNEETNFLQRPSVLDGLWNGSYSCSSSKSELQIGLLYFQDEFVKGLIKFQNDPSLGNGTFVFEGSIFKSGKVRLKGTEWTQATSNGKPFDVEGQVSRDLKSIGGIVTSPNCTTFIVSR